MKYKAIIFDFDGVICDSVDVKTKAFASLYASYGSEIEQLVVNYHLAHGGISRFNKIQYFEESLLNKSISEKEIDEKVTLFASLVKEKVISSNYLPGAIDFIKKMSKVVPLFICTGTPEFEIIEIADKRGILPFFNGIYGSPTDKKSIISNILNKHHFSSSEVVYFGDATTDQIAAKGFDMPLIGIRNNDTVFDPGTNLINDFNDSLLSFLIGL
jgi:beta-phosphoglucomutase-like phosphatase (HAD superfamily)